MDLNRWTVGPLFSQLQGPQEISPRGRLTAWEIHRTENSPCGNFTEREFRCGKIRRMVNSAHGKFAVWKFHREGISLQENSPCGNFTVREFLCRKIRRMGNSPHGKFAVRKFHREGISLRVISSRGIFTARKIHRTEIHRVENSPK